MDGMVRMIMVVVAALVVFGAALDIEVVPPVVEAEVPSGEQVASTDCVTFQSPGRLTQGTLFRAALLNGLEFRLSSAWSISVGPAGEPTMDYLWPVSPPLQTAPHLVIGPGYGMTARQSAQIPRPLRFVTTRADYDAARAAIELQSAEETLKQLDQLGRGHLTLAITDYRIRDVTLADGRQSDAFEWIVFKGKACVPKQKAG
jgi:hypothetical protein